MAQYTYDETGRVKTKKLAGETSTYDYNIRSWLTGITGNKFSQTLAYNQTVNGITPSKFLYGGNISAMKWKAGTETTERGYKFAYDGLNRLTAASYGEGASLTANLNRFNETLSYDKMGNILTLQRQGKLDSGYGLMDSLTYTYTGNQLTKVSDAVTTPITYPGAFHFVDRANVENEYAYDTNGNLTKDLNKNIASISYNVLNLPGVVSFSDGNSISYGYDASGNKLSAAYKVGSTTAKTEYSGNKVYKNGTLSMILTEEGYITLSGTTPTYHYYLKDHQGNNRVVIDQSGTVEQVNHYYPFGGMFGEGIQTSNQPYRYNGKELDRLFGLDIYDYVARNYDAAIGRWLIVDPLVEKYYAESPYVYVYNSPIIHIDPDGKDGLVIISGNNITIKSNIILTGSLATDRLAKIYKQDIMDNWGLINSYSHNGAKYNIKWDVNVRVALANEKRNFDGINNYLEVKRDITSKVYNTNWGEIRSTNLELENPMSHEFGHILGLRDKYVTDKSAQNYGQPISKDWEWNIMGTKAGHGVVENKNMDQILDTPLKWEGTRKLLQPIEPESTSVFKFHSYDLFKETRYWINNENREN